jgi:integrase
MPPVTVFRLVVGPSAAETLAGEQLDQVVPRRPGPRRHDQNQGLRQYPDGTWGIDLILHGRRVREKVGKLSEARRRRDDVKAAERRGELAPAKPSEKPRKRTLADWLQEYTSIPRGKTNTEFARRWSAAIGKLYPEQFTLEHLRHWAHQRLKAGAEIASVRRMMDPLRACYREILRAGALGQAQDPFRDMRALRLPKVNNKRDSYVLFSSVPALVEAFGPWWPYAEFAMLTSMRLGNQRALRWDDIDWQGRSALLRRTKKGSKFNLRLSDLALQLLREQQARLKAAGVDSEWCWPNSQGGQLHPSNFRQRVWGPAFAKAGLKTLRQGRNGLTWHDLSRHTPAVWLAQSGENRYTLQGVMDHADFRMTERYIYHCQDDPIRGAMDRLAVLLRQAAEGAQSVNRASISQSTSVDVSRNRKPANADEIRIFPN